MEFSNKDFNADKVQQYEEVRKGMGRILNSAVSSDEVKIQNDLIKQGTNECTNKSKNWDKTSK